MEDNLKPNTTISHYRIVEKIGAGGMGEVYLAEDTKLDRKVALKILPPEFAEDNDRMNRFVREAKSASALNHPNIITIHEIGEAGGAHFIATEFIEGKTLSEYAKSNPLNFKLALDIAIQIASALDEAHTAGIIHRDIKPDNVMVRSNGLVKILDFGIAKLSARGESNEEAATAIKGGTSPGMIIGTANYMSPEQAKGKEVDARTDVFSFGAVLYEMIAGKLPFEGETALEMIGAILKDEPKPINNPDVPPEIKKVVGKCLRKDRNERYQTIKDVLIDLRDVKQELEFQNKLERTIPPEKEEPKTQILRATTSDETNRATTDQTVAANPKTKRLAIGLAVVLLSAVGFFAYRYFTPGSKQIESIAVMPFVNESGNADNEYLSDGMTETLISNLSQLPNLSVKARSSVFRYKGKEIDSPQIGKELNVQAVLNGRVVQRGQDLTLYVELVDTATEKVLWSEQYKRRQVDLVSLQSEIARDVSQKLRVKLSGADEQKLAKNYTENAEAYQLYLKGRFYWNKRTPDNFRKAIEYFNQALAAEPNYALAYTGLADSYALLAIFAGGESPREVMPKAKDAALKALSLDNNLAEAHAALGQILHNYDYDFDGAEREYKRAIELNPNYAPAYQWYSELLSGSGRHDEALGKMRKALEIDPLSLIVNRVYGFTLFYARQYDASIAQLKKTVELDANFPGPHLDLHKVYRMKGNYAESVEEFAKWSELLGRQQDSSLMRESFAKGGWQGFLRAMTGTRRPSGLKSSNVATFYAALDEKDKAFRELNEAYDKRESDMMWLKVDPQLDPLRDDPRFEEMLRKVGFPQ